MTHALTTVILAAGKGTRMKSAKAKVLHELMFAPMIHHVLDAVKPLNSRQNIVVAGHQRKEVEISLAGYHVDIAIQEEQLGTGHAVMAAQRKLQGEESTVMILCGDTPLLTAKRLSAMYEHHMDSNATVTVMTTELDNPTNYGRIVSDDQGRFTRIVEEKDSTDTEKCIKEVNSGIYCVEQSFLFDNLQKIGSDNAQNEIYLTDIVALAVDKGLTVEKFINSDSDEIMGVNSRTELAKAHALLQMRRNRELMDSGVTMYSPETILIGPQVTIEPDTIIHANTTITGSSNIMKNCCIQQGCFLSNVQLNENSYIKPYTILTD